MALERPLKLGNVRRYTDEVLAGFDNILAEELDADLDLIYGFVSQQATGDLTGYWPSLSIGAGKVTDAKIASVAWTKVTGAPASYPPVGAAAGDLSGNFPAPSIGDSKVTFAKLATDVLINGGSLYVNPSGIANPPNPLGGNVANAWFDTIGNAWTWLTRRRVQAALSINVAAGTYAPVSTLSLRHPDSRHISIAGADKATTIWQNTGSGFWIQAPGLAAISGLTIRASGGAALSGIRMDAGGELSIDNLVIENFQSYQLWLKHARVISATNCVFRTNIATAVGVQLNLSMMEANAGATFDGPGRGIVMEQGSTFLNVNTLAMTFTGLGLPLTISQGRFETKGAITATGLDNALAYGVEVADHGEFVLTATGPADNVSFTRANATAIGVRAQTFALGKVGTRLVAAGRTASSPAIGVLGNNQALIL